jgi:hypothetical protein
MPDNIDILKPNVLRGVVEKFAIPETLVLSSTLRRTPWPYPSAEWDVVKGSRNIAGPNVPNSEATIVPRLGISRQAASFIYLREKKVFEPTTLHWLRQPGTVSNIEKAESAVLREVKDLNQRFDNYVEYACWQILTGSLTIDTPEVQATIDSQIPVSHKASAAVSWASATAQQIKSDVSAWKALINRDARVPAKDAYLTEATVDRIFNAFAATPTLLSDSMKDRYYTTGQLPGFLGLNWHVVDSYFENSAGVTTSFVPNDAVFITNLTDNNPLEIVEGPSADDEAPEGHTGKFSKTWKEKDPSARQFLLEYHFLPTLTRPEQVVYVNDVAP